MTPRDRRALTDAAHYLCLCAIEIRGKRKTLRGARQRLYGHLLQTARDLCRMHDRGMKA